MIAEKLIAATPWAEYRISVGGASHIGESLRQLLSSNSPESADAAYWQLENNIVAQGTVYSAAVPTMRILASSLVDVRPLWVRISALELMYQVLSGQDAPGEANHGSNSLVSQCAKIVSEALWLIIREYVNGPREAAEDVLKLLATDIDYSRLAQ